MIAETLQLIKEQIGLELVLCDYFTGVRGTIERPFFNIELSVRTSESAEFIKLQRFSNDYGLIHVEPNGLNRVAIFVNKT